VALDPEQYQRYVNFMAEQGQPVQQQPVGQMILPQNVNNPLLTSEGWA
jgi:hypothetical protein